MACILHDASVSCQQEAVSESTLISGAQLTPADTADATPSGTRKSIVRCGHSSGCVIASKQHVPQAHSAGTFAGALLDNIWCGEELRGAGKVLSRLRDGRGIHRATVCTTPGILTRICLVVDPHQDLPCRGSSEDLG